MDNFLLLVPLAISVGHCVVSACLFRRVNSRISFLEERLASLTLPIYPPPPPYPQPTSYYNVPQGYGYSYSGGQTNLGQGNLGQGNLNVI